jgi:hypothetical protein
MGIKIEELQALEILQRLPDSTPLAVEEAALFIRRSPSWLEKSRRLDASEPGPRYLQGGDPKRKSNHKVLYFKKDLVDWLEGRSNCLTNLFEGATAARIMEPFEGCDPFWLDASGSIAGNVEESEIDEFVERIADKGNWRIDWLPAEEAGFIADSGMRLATAD